MAAMRPKTIGARCPIGTKMPTGRRAGVGGIGASPCAPRFRTVLSLHGKLARSRRSEPGSFSQDLPVNGELSFGRWRISDVAHERNAKFAGGSLPANEAGPANGFDRRRDAATGRKALVDPDAVQATGRLGTQRPDPACVVEAFAGVARSRNPAGLAGSGIQRNSRGFIRARRNGKIEN